MTDPVPTGPGAPRQQAVRERLSAAGRRAVRSREWRQVAECAQALIAAGPADAEGYFLLGLAAKAAHRSAEAIAAFDRARTLDPGRYDATVELAAQHQRTGEYGVAVRLLRGVDTELGGSPYYLDMAGTIYAKAGLPEEAWHAYVRANDLQPGIDALRARLAATCVHVGRGDEAAAIYAQLLAANPQHQRNHYELARLRTAHDRRHVEQMLEVLEASRLPPTGNIYLYYAIGKELEDLEEWDDAFDCYQRAGDAAASAANYDVADDVGLIDAIIDTCTADWLATGAPPAGRRSKSPVFVVGLPRSGTTLVERILSAHTRVGSAGESFFVPMALQQIAGQRAEAPAVPGPVCVDVIRAAASAGGEELARRYLAAIDYRLGPEPLFVEKLPENLLYLGFLARAFPDARFVHLTRHPLDVCLALYKQSFFRYAYTLADLGRYYPAYHRLARYWRDLLGDRLVDIEYERLVSDPERSVRSLLDRLGLPFQQSCIDFHRNPAATNTASAAQVREPMHTRSVGRWRHFAAQLEPLARELRAAGIDV